MKWYVVVQTEYSGWDCTGHEIPYLVAANSKAEALALFNQDIDPLHILELNLPDLSRKKKAFILDLV
jgi:hypothetical protein